MYRYVQSSKTMKRSSPNIIITGTPGVGKTTHCELLSQKTGLQHISVNQVVKDQGCHEGWDENLASWIVDEDKVSFKPWIFFNGSFFKFPPHQRRSRSIKSSGRTPIPTHLSSPPFFFLFSWQIATNRKSLLAFRSLRRPRAHGRMPARLACV